MYEHVKTSCKHISPSKQPLKFQSGYYLNKPRTNGRSMATPWARHRPALFFRPFVSMHFHSALGDIKRMLP